MKDTSKKIKEFEAFLTFQGYNKRTIYSYQNNLLRFFAFLKEKDLTFIQIRTKEAMEFQGWLLEYEKRKYSKGTVLNILKSATAFYNYLKNIKEVYTNPFRHIKKVREERKLPKTILKEKEIVVLLKELSKYYEEPTMRRIVSVYRIHVIAELMYSTGMRIFEIAELKEEDIDFITGTIKLTKTKGDDHRIVFLNEYAKQILHYYVKEIRELIFYRWNKTTDRLFGVNVKRLTLVVNEGLKRACLKLKLPVITSHGFRHALGFHLLRAGCSIRYIQEILGHSSLKSTEVYTKVDKQDLKDMIKKYHPRKWNSR